MSGGHGHVEGGEQEDCPAGRRPGGLPGDLGNGRQERADPCFGRAYRRLEPVVVLPGQDDPPDDHADRRRCDRGAVQGRRRSRCRPALKKQVETWRKTAQRYETEPETNEGRKELAARAKVKEAGASKAMSAYHMFEYGSAALQLAIVLAGASALTSVMAWLLVVSVRPGPASGWRSAPGLLRADPDPPLGTIAQNAQTGCTIGCGPRRSAAAGS